MSRVVLTGDTNNPPKKLVIIIFRIRIKQRSFFLFVVKPRVGWELLNLQDACALYVGVRRRLGERVLHDNACMYAAVVVIVVVDG